MAQSEGGARTYKKVSSDTVQLKRIPVKKSGSAVKKKPANKKPSAPKVKKVKVDSIVYTPRQYVLGERVIMPGDSGRDVRAMAKILVNKLYIDEASLIYTSGGGVLYEGELVKAVKHFQEFNGFYVDGIVGQDLIKALRKRKTKY